MARAVSAEELEVLLRAGATDRAIAEAYGVDERTVRRWVQRAGFFRRFDTLSSQGAAMVASADTAEELEVLLRAGATDRAIAEAYGVDGRALFRAVRLLRLPCGASLRCASHAARHTPSSRASAEPEHQRQAWGEGHVHSHHSVR